MRAAIICATYERGKSYQENIWAEQLAKAGHAVRLFFPGPQDGAVENVQPGGYDLVQVKTWQFPRSMYWSSRLPHHVSAFQPDLIVICGDKTFCVPLARDRRLANAVVISTYSENAAMHEFNWRKPGTSLKQRLWAIGFIVTRFWPIRVVNRRSNLVVGNTPQAREILSRLFSKREWPQIEGRMIDMPLGFSPDHFGYFAQMRRAVRAELGVAERDILVCMSSHFGPVKEYSIKVIIRALRRAMVDHPSLQAVIVGFSDKPGYADVTARIRDYLDQEPKFQHRFIEHPFAHRDRLVQLYNASDIAVFNRASISCQEALGTGLVCCFSDDGSLNHLVTRPNQGFFFRPGDEAHLAAKLGEAVAALEPMQGEQRESFRRMLADGSRWLGYDLIIKATLERVGLSLHAA